VRKSYLYNEFGLSSNVDLCYLTNAGPDHP